MRTAANGRGQLWGVVEAAIGRWRVADQLPPGVRALLPVPFRDGPDAFCQRVMAIGERAGWDVATEVAACVWCFYTYFCAVTRHPETALWDAIAAAMHGHPQSLAAFPYLRQLSLLLGAEPSELPGGRDLPAGLARVLWAFTEAVTREADGTARGVERAWAWLAGLGFTPLDRAVALGPYVALTGRAPDEGTGAGGENRISFN